MANSRVRLLPVLGVVALGVFAVKAVSIAEAAGARAAAASASERSSAAPVTAEPVSDTDAPELDSEDNSSAKESGDSCPAPDMIAEQAGLSQYEIQVLRTLSDRREQLDAREVSLDTRELTISAAESRLNDQISELERLETSIQSLLGELDDRNDEQLASLVKLYENMKPKDAARIVNTLDDQLMLSIADRMKPANMAAILADMDIERARTLTTLMAQKTEPPQTVADLEARTNEP